MDRSRFGPEELNPRFGAVEDVEGCRLRIKGWQGKGIAELSNNSKVSKTEVVSFKSLWIFGHDVEPVNPRN